MSIPLSYSLRARLLFFLLAAIAVGALVQGAIAYRSTLQQADDIFDSLLQRTALSLGTGDGLLRMGPAHAKGSATPMADDLIIQIWTPDGVRVFNSRSRRPLPDQIVLGFADAEVEGSTYRVYSLATPFQVIQVAQDMQVRKRMAGALAWRTVAPIAAAAPLLMLIVWCVVSWSLRPVKRARAQVAARRPEDLSPINVPDLPDEIRPLMQELNLLLERMRGAFAQQKQFVGDAAHELRSPLAALNLQLQSLRRASDDASRRVAEQRLAAGIERATRLVEQLLSMARHENHAEQPPAETVDLADVVRLALSETLPAANAKDIGIELHGAPQAMVRGRRDDLVLLARNLLDNAIKYTPAGGHIAIRLDTPADGARLLIDDNGPGIPPAERARVFDRFYRLDGNTQPGSGLGLAIARAIAERHDAIITLEDVPGGPGLRARVVFPPPQSAT
ncbi:ATP-binding protein [Achromobacter dolens]|uniref:ATP-binding protein n=1 Tax=Achromobacter dolens TaxID=1287738 RepID=UPI0007E2124A|nr:ATP-binding protein [Achromobacter dolens]MCZ8407305.1 ATP-binding protein [Achromobacter dolens]OAS90585.1 two-component sensor histidine kinase [Achromobacter xylosoxidans]